MNFSESTDPDITHRVINIDGVEVHVTPTEEHIYRDQIQYHHLKMSKGLIAVYDITSRKSYELI